MKRIKLEITALAPLAIGRQKPGGSISEVEMYIPGSVLRGAIAGLMIRQAQAEGVDFADDPESDFKALFIDGQAIFRNAYPAIADLGEHLQINSEVRVLPATALSAKSNSGFKPNGNGVFDVLIDRFWAEQFGQVYDPSCPQDGGRVDPYQGFYSVLSDRYHSHTISTRLLTRVGINRARSTAEDQILYSTQVLNEVKRKRGTSMPMVFGGDVLVEDGIAQDFHEYLARNATNFRLGGSASRGLGKVRLELELIDHESDMASAARKRIVAFNAALHNRWNLWQMFDHAQTNPAMNRTFFTIGLQSEAILRERWQRSMVISADLLQAALGNLPGDLRLEVANSSYDYRTGWNSAWGLMKDTELVTNPGSVYLFSIDQAHQEVWMAALAGLENSGVGERTTEGFGQVRICDEFHCISREAAV